MMNKNKIASGSLGLLALSIAVATGVFSTNALAAVETRASTQNATKISKNMESITANTKSITANTKSINGLSERITGEAKSTDIRFAQTYKGIGNNTTKIATNTKSINGLSERITGEAKSTDIRFAQTYKGIGNNTTKIATNIKSIDDLQHSTTENEARSVSNANKIADNSKRLDLSDKWQKMADQRLSDLEGDVRHNRKVAARGTAGVAAMANIPTPAIPGSTSFGVGIGHYDSESALAVGMSHYFENGISIKGSAGLTSGQSILGAGISKTW
ncbi:YadA C-terminal domain-containing protein [Photobacterium damselae]|uniref:Outer membrane protein n=2 Tax=Photobacterium damselae TaxID=38293 RepID=D0Z4X6_PHODD|nr:YadA C-terminal domain-containing protein [Photobacterium damselae]EEZ39193.1 outer membrane protein [Photobacterium damselae subsp. damselae CIP 102761]PSW78594.1 hypothetical protein CTN07_20980 [Photobacterium damselae]SPY45076.1 YadA-like C-terminal region [Photobacterium damselae]